MREWWQIMSHSRVERGPPPNLFHRERADMERGCVPHRRDMSVEYIMYIHIYFTYNSCRRDAVWSIVTRTLLCTHIVSRASVFLSLTEVRARSTLIDISYLWTTT